MAAKMSSDVYTFSNEIKIGLLFTHHGLAIEGFGIHATEHDLSFFPT
jgi:hypothetical protein